MRCIRLMLKLSGMMKNAQVREKIMNTDTIENKISKRRLIFIGKIIRMPRKSVSARNISIFQTNKRLVGRPNMTVRNSFINDI